MDEAERLCDRIAIIDHGSIIALGTPADLIERLGGHHMIEFMIADRAQTEDNWGSLRSVEGVHVDGGRIVLSVREPHETIPLLLSAVQSRGLRLEHLTTRQASLEDVFVHLTGRHLREE
jgi:ABC-2 type transport system ATP-binding protein